MTAQRVSAADVRAALPASPMALRAEDEGWHRVSRAERDGFRATCGTLVALADVEAVDAWADIHDLGTSYCIECLAIGEGEWTRSRFPQGTAVAYVLALWDRAERIAADKARRGVTA